MKNEEMNENELPNSSEDNLRNEERRKSIAYLVQFIHTICKQKNLTIKTFTEVVAVGTMMREYFMTEEEQKYYDKLLLTK